MNQPESFPADNSSKPIRNGSTSAVPEWMTETINGGSFRIVDLHTGTNGWASPPGDVFSLRGTDFFTNKQKCPGGDYLFSPVGVDWLKSSAKLDNILARSDNRVAHALSEAQSRGQSLNSFIFAVNFRVPGKEPYNLVLYYATEEPIPSDSVLHRFIHGDDSYRNQKFKLVSQVVKGPWIVKAAAGNFGAFLIGKTVKCSYHRGSNYFEIDVDISSSTILTAAVRLSLTHITKLRLDIGFVVEAQSEDELPERLIGAVQICHMELSSAFVVDPEKPLQPPRMMGSGKPNHEEEYY